MDVFVARQPIFDRQIKVFAYELLFRSGPENYFTGTDYDASSSKVISDGVSLLGLDMLIGRKRAFVNFSRAALVNDFAFVLPRERVVIEVLETVEPDNDVVAAVRRLKDAGYQLALDDFESVERFEPLLDMVDYVKVDFLATTAPEDRATLSRLLSARGIRMVAEKVETREDVDEAVRTGYTLFQGFFFARPVMIPAKEVPGFRLNYLKLVNEINLPETRPDRLEEIMKQEVSMAYRLLRYINSAAFGFRAEVTSIKHAIVLLGLQEIRKLATVWALAGLGRDRPVELVVTSTTRARFCELIACAAGREESASRAFLVGMFSLIDAIIGRPISDLMDSLSIGPDERAALLGQGGPLKTILDCVIAYERGEWESCLALAAQIGLDEPTLADQYLRATDWSRGIFAA